ncbi:DegV family protein [Mycobacterium sp. CVI_P3]|uniref:DegV family protein n=1 Tax=Mycobacterium pinniadriaticum TaxID=2994102 RepID=A0ABT3SD67_9MYCO|nr:DegV family protein [Mycobacterium pinniadriaticum]MCX2931034.1 DegV family protein [Mycobacterium pinniadriaticum]MCX2937458.1 DegV family protein [Mycobacterium pinniadriaticum]
MAVVVVTDSSARLPADDVRSCGIRVVPLHILIEGRDLRDGVDPVPADLYQRGHVSTAGATPTELAEAYRDALRDSGGEGVVAVHISAELSSTLGAAEYAAREFGGAVRVVDSKSTAMGTGFVALAAARAAFNGADLETVAAEAQSAVSRVHAYIVVHRLDNLRRSGRIGTTASWLGTALALKPLLRIDEQGRLVLAQRVRTASKAQAAMVEQVLELVGERRAALAVHHIDNPAAAAEISATLAAALPGCGDAVVTDLGPVLGVHVGTGAVGIVVALDPTDSIRA